MLTHVNPTPKIANGVFYDNFAPTTEIPNSIARA